MLTMRHSGVFTVLTVLCVCVCVFNILRQEFGTAGNWQTLHPHEWVKKVQPFIREDYNLMGRVHTWTERTEQEMKTEGGEGGREGKTKIRLRDR